MAKAVDEKVVKDVIRGVYGNGAERVKKLTAAGYDAAAVQAEVNKALKAPAAAPAKKSLEVVAKEVIQGKYGNGAERVKKLTEAGYDASAVQKMVNAMLKK